MIGGSECCSYTETEPNRPREATGPRRVSPSPAVKSTVWNAWETQPSRQGNPSPRFNPPRRTPKKSQGDPGEEDQMDRAN